MCVSWWELDFWSGGGSLGWERNCVIVLWESTPGVHVKKESSYESILPSNRIKKDCLTCTFIKLSFSGEVETTLNEASIFSKTILSITLFVALQINWWVCSTYTYTACRGFNSSSLMNCGTVIPELTGLGHRLIYKARSPKFIWAPCACTALLIGWDLATPPPHLGSYTTRRYWSPKIDDISLWPPGLGIWWKGDGIHLWFTQETKYFLSGLLKVYMNMQIKV